jgi:hypothetical protein
MDFNIILSNQLSAIYSGVVIAAPKIMRGHRHGPAHARPEKHLGSCRSWPITIAVTTFVEDVQERNVLAAGPSKRPIEKITPAR